MVQTTRTHDGVPIAIGMGIIGIKAEAKEEERTEFIILLPLQ